MALTAEQRDTVHWVEWFAVKQDGVDTLKLCYPGIIRVAVVLCSGLVHANASRQRKTPEGTPPGVWHW